MSSVKIKVVSVFFKLKPTLKQEPWTDMSRKVSDKAEYHYRKLDKLKPKEKSAMIAHRTMWTPGPALYRAMQDKPGNRDDLVDIVLKVLWRSALCDLIKLQAFFVRRSEVPSHLFLRLLGPGNERFFHLPAPGESEGRIREWRSLGLTTMPSR